MKNTLLTTFAFAVVSLGVMTTTKPASGQNAILSEMYGRGVHAYYAGRTSDAQRYLSMAIDNGIQDPRAYYFRGMVAQSLGQSYQSDWQLGAEMEASGRTNPAVGRSLARFQGAARIELEEIRQSARLQAAATAAARSKQRYGEIDATAGQVSSGPPAAAPAAPAKAVTPPPAPAVADPFADDMAEGQPKVVADDALDGAMNNPFADDGTAAGAGAPAAAGDSNPFGGGGDAGGADPFGGGSDAGGADPFGGGSDAGGADPFGGGSDAGADPFGGGTDAGGADPFAG